MFDGIAPEFFEVPGTAAEESINPIAHLPQQIVPCHPVVVVDVANHWLNR